MNESARPCRGKGGTVFRSLLGAAVLINFAIISLSWKAEKNLLNYTYSRRSAETREQIDKNNNYMKELAASQIKLTENNTKK